MASKKTSKKAAPKRSARARANGKHADAEERIERARYPETLACKFDPVDLPERADALARVVQEREGVLEDKREANAKYREKLAALNERMSELAEQVGKKLERREVECVEYFIPRLNKVEVIRSDTGEVISQRAAKAEDRQEDLGLNDPGGSNNVRANPDEDEAEVPPDTEPPPAPSTPSHQPTAS